MGIVFIFVLLLGAIFLGLVCATITAVMMVSIECFIERIGRK